MEPRRDVTIVAPQMRSSIVLVLLLVMASFCVFSAPLVEADGARDASIMLSVSPSTLTVNPGESGEYTITVRNLGSDPVSGNIQTSEAQTQECGSYSSQIAPGGNSFNLDGGELHETTMEVTLAQGATDECETTVTASAADQGTPPGQPDSQESTVTTKSGDGESSPLYGVDLKTDDPDLDWDGSAEMIWDVEVENTGRVNETVVLTIDENDGPNCDPSDLEIEVDPSTVSLDNETSEWVEVRATVPEGSSAAKFCWTLHAQVQNDPTQNASDDLDLDLIIPEIHDCDVQLSTSMLNIDPDMTGTATVTYTNTGNTQFTIGAVVTGAKASDWVNFEGVAVPQTSGILPYDGEDNQKEFTIEITPDDSVDAGSEQIFKVEGHDGASGPIKCEAELRVIVGQSHGGAISLSSSSISQVEPGGNGSVTVTVMNLGNGQDTLKLSTSAPPSGWGVSLSSSTVNVGSRHGSSNQATVEVVVNAPLNALADDAITITIYVLPNGGGEAYDSDNVSISIMPIHSWDVKDSTIFNQTGRSGTLVHFPITIVNDGNIGDNFIFAVTLNTRSNWATHFMDGQDPITSVVVPAFSEKTVNLAVSIDAEGVGEERDSATVTIRVTNSDDHNNDDLDNDNIPDNQRELTFKAMLSNRNHSMGISIDEAWSYSYGEPGSVQVILAPGGSVSVPVWIENTGDYTDDVYFTLGGLEGIGTRSLQMGGVDIALSGNQVEVPKAFAAWNLTSQDYEAHNDESLSFHKVWKFCDEECAENGVDQWISSNSDNQSHETRVYKIKAVLTILVSDGAESGDVGSATITVSSTKNTVQQSSVNIPISVQSIQKISIDAGGVEELTVNYPDTAEFTSTIENEGNTPSEVRIFTSEGLRGWVVSLEAMTSSEISVIGGVIMPANTCSVDEGIELICTIQPGTNLTVKAIVKSPHGTAVADDFTFTLSAEPIDLEIVGRVNQELEVHGMPEEGGLSFLGTTEGVASVGGILLLLLTYVFIEPKRRARVAEKAARPKYENELEPLPVNPSGAKRFKTNSFEMSVTDVGGEAQVSVTSKSSDNELGFAIRPTKGKGKKDIWVFADKSRMKPQLHCIHRSKKKRIFDVMDMNSNMPFCVVKNNGKKMWSLLRVDGSPWLNVVRSGMGTKTWTFTSLDGEDKYGSILVSKTEDGSAQLSAERYTTDLDARAVWLTALAILIG